MVGSPETARGPRVITQTAAPASPSGRLRRGNDVETQRESMFAVAAWWPGSVSEYVCPPSWAMLCCTL